MKRLVIAIDRLIVFLTRVRIPGEDERDWTRSLMEIRNGLLDPSARTEALNKFEACFGGMGSLNDYLFHPQNNNVPLGEDAARLNRELDRLLDRCYMEFRLLDRSLWVRVYWRWLALRHRGAPPRVLNAFARRLP